MARDYKDHAPGQVPAWLQGPYGAAWVAAMADLLDSLVFRIKSGVKARMIGLAPPDAVPLIGSERGGIERGRGETLAQYRARLADAWAAWVHAGTPKGLLRALDAAGYPARVAQVRGGLLFSLDADGELVTTKTGGEWFLDYSDFWSRFDVILDDVWGGSPPAENSAEADSIRRIINQWRSGYATLHKIRIVLNGGFWGDGNAWNDGSLWTDTDDQEIWDP